jgi:hypothetical protein
MRTAGIIFSGGFIQIYNFLKQNKIKNEVSEIPPFCRNVFFLYVPFFYFKGEGNRKSCKI